MATPEKQFERLSDLLTQQKTAAGVAGAVSSEERIDRLQQVINVLCAEKENLASAMQADFGGRHPGFSVMTDILGSLGPLKYAQDHLESWMKPQKREMFSPYDQLGATAQVILQPKGSIGIMGTWNAPVYTLISPLACALSAGNRAILKPSEITARTADVLAEAFDKRIDPSLIGVVTGGAALGARFASSPFNHLVFTGSTIVGRKVMRAAAENLVPVTLELGGKSPAILSRSARLEESCRRIAIAKGNNGGQICVSPDILYVPTELLDTVVANICDTYRTIYPTVADNPDYTAVATEGHLSRLENYLKDARASGVRIVSSHPDEYPAGSERRMPLQLLIDPPESCKVMQEELFGPLLVIRSYDKTGEVILDINSRSNPLALYYYGENEAERNCILQHTLSGGVAINDALIHAAVHDAPFGGVGASGMGKYHGYEGFLEFSHMRTVYSAPENDPRGEWGLLPPYYDGFTDAMLAQVAPE